MIEAGLCCSLYASASVVGSNALHGHSSKVRKPGISFTRHLLCWTAADAHLPAHLQARGFVTSSVQRLPGRQPLYAQCGACELRQAAAAQSGEVMVLVTHKWLVHPGPQVGECSAAW